nr:metal-dependent hydrolase [Natrinema versiforme]
MVDVTGHLGMALLFAAPAWTVWGRRGALGFAAFALVTAMLPDTDLALRHVLPVTHHGVTHTVLFVVLLSVLAGAVAARYLTDWFKPIAGSGAPKSRPRPSSSSRRRG